MQITKYHRHAGRIAEIAMILGRYGLADWLSWLDFDWLHGRLATAEGTALKQFSRAERIRMALIELGPTFVKLGQILSTRGDLIGPELSAELTKLQANTPADDGEAVRAIVEEELGRPLGELFEEFDVEAVASASIGQVHRAKLFDGAPVVVKVQHEGIEDVIQRDLEILMELARLAEEHSDDLRAYKPTMTAREFRRLLLSELDFARELRNLLEFRDNFEEDETVHIPAPHAALSSRRVLTMEWIDGVSIANANELREQGHDLARFAQRGVDMYMNMIFRDGFYHADPHAGNLFYMQGGVVGVIDCGMVGRIDEMLRDQFEELLLAIVQKDADRLTENIVRLGAIPSTFDRMGLRSDLSLFVEEFGAQSVKDFDLSGALDRFFDIVRQHHVVLPTNCTLLIKTLAMLEGTARALSPTFSLGEVMAGHEAEILKRRYSPKRIKRRLQRTYRDWDRLLDMLPRHLADVLGRVTQGSFDVHLDHRRLDSIINRLVVGLLCSSMFIASTVLWALDAKPLLFGISVFGIAGFGFAVALTARLLYAIHKSGDLNSRGR